MNTMPHLEVDSEFEKLFGPLDEDEYQTLKKLVLRDGKIINPILTWNNILIDGHHRYKILCEHPTLEYRIQELHFENRFQVISWICNQQIGRRNITAVQKTILMARQYDAEKKAHGASDGFRGNQYTVDDLVRCNSCTLPKTSQAAARKVAADMKVSPRTVFYADEFVKGMDTAELIDPGISDDISSGKIKPTRKEVATVAKAPEELREKVVANLRVSPKNLTEVEKKQRKELFDSIDRLYAQHTNPNQPKATGKDMISPFEADVDIAIDTLSGYLSDYPDMVSDPTLKEQVIRIIGKIKKFVEMIEEN